MGDIKTINIKDKEYPKLLKKIDGSPKTLYIKGELNPDDICFGVVGTRRFSPYGKQVAFEIAGDLAEAGLTIVSGLAPGIDTFAHQAALEKGGLVRRSPKGEGGRTIAVLGTGIDEKSIYPQSNLKLAKDIVESGGCLISEYAPGTQGWKGNFPARNRIISGLSLGVLVVEAKEKSGALITANDAFKQKRRVFAVPGSIYSPNSRGPHILIKKGATLVVSAEDILKELNLPRMGKKKELKGDTKEEELILRMLMEEALNIDKIIKKTGLAPATVNSFLAILEIKGKIRNLGGGIYSLKK